MTGQFLRTTFAFGEGPGRLEDAGFYGTQTFLEAESHIALAISQRIDKRVPAALPGSCCWCNQPKDIYERAGRLRT